MQVDTLSLLARPQRHVIHLSELQPPNSMRPQVTFEVRARVCVAVHVHMHGALSSAHVAVGGACRLQLAACCSPALLRGMHITRPNRMPTSGIVFTRMHLHWHAHPQRSQRSPPAPVATGIVHETA